ncbi:transcription repressor NadR [Geosporobacter ferrireducens]|uniref:DNA-binding transcriptional regulator n=1 Tax=Geosporobacter ferrireducens TaxID=1424294 RepID=A0A1D8GHL1_9FIRM|nr:transcription repressor NadR [Geosporobacter ferrireducens]AOT70411.1 hypothetical protein Gferi_12965 [Geosporobacter ferrireducens]MTI58148.1 transcription repressor NadR [Geosporobacter ferrireducens]
MLSEKRRQRILEMLKMEEEAVTGGALAKAFDVSRQVIVQDIAVLRAQGYDILATANGYMLPKPQPSDRYLKAIACRHMGYEEMEEELTIMVDMGAKILDVVVDHPVYGKISRNLMICSRMDVQDFMHKVKTQRAEPLSSLTGGEHIHHLELPSERAYKRMMETLVEKGFFLREVTAT